MSPFSLSSLLGTRPLLYTIGALFVALLLAVADGQVQRAERKAAESAAEAEIQAYDAQLAVNRAAADAKARVQERRHAKALAGVAASYEQEKTDAKLVADAVERDLRAGLLRLHNRWEAHVATAGLVSGVVAGTCVADGRSDDRAASAGRIVRAAAECDAQVRGLQRVIERDRALGREP